MVKPWKWSRRDWRLMLSMAQDSVVLGRMALQDAWARIWWLPLVVSLAGFLAAAFVFKHAWNWSLPFVNDPCRLSYPASLGVVAALVLLAAFVRSSVFRELQGLCVGVLVAGAALVYFCLAALPWLVLWLGCCLTNRETTALHRWFLAPLELTDRKLFLSRRKS